MRLLLLTALLLLIVTPHSLYANEAGKQKEFIGPPNCPPNYYGDRTTTRCFGFPKKDPKDAKTWVEAEKACREQGGLLAILSGNGDGAKVLQYLRSEAIKHGVHGAWVAANDGPTKNNFAWLDDSPVTPSGLLKYHAKYPEEHEGPSW
ncbi:hypothetical protein BV898_05066 [Hypsibius exemplaris]|uniref:C-type lectin domain-containing protein n=1 Tax=Hypsibius exemplaris TaxID=2072580 RepID=A0A1W0X0K9_HYPEX|nr:hypothetical protein BV898_05066 [Hypsibius exemplaris]